MSTPHNITENYCQFTATRLPADRYTQVLYITVNQPLWSFEFKKILPRNLMRVKVIHHLKIQRNSIALLLCLTDSDWHDWLRWCDLMSIEWTGDIVNLPISIYKEDWYFCVVNPYKSLYPPPWHFCECVIDCSLRSQDLDTFIRSICEGISDNN